MADEQRRYRKRRRAAQEQETRRRITEAVMELHRTVGPARTKVTEVAERAGVSRMTVYNHFPTEADLVDACSTHWGAQNPFPDPASWRALEDPEDRLRAALSDLYGFYGDTEDMMGNVLRDAPIVEPLGEIMDQRWQPYLDAVVETLEEAWSDEGGTRVERRAALRVAVDFRTWRLLSDAIEEIDDAVSIAARMVVGGASSAA